MKSLLLVVFLFAIASAVYSLEPIEWYRGFGKRIYDDLYRNTLNYERRMDELDGTLDLQKFYQNFDK
uniref:Cathepsin propeptide inhibitor domain-containing protein n=1 Tax=Ascaris lumbricoides TaxID=6252 RepID=A0A0M3HY07_ASCLU